MKYSAILLCVALLLTACTRIPQDGVPSAMPTSVPQSALPYQLMNDKDESQILESKEYSFRVKIPTDDKGDKLKVWSNEYGWQLTPASSKLGQEFAIWISPPKEQSSEIFLSYIAQQSRKATTDGFLLVELPEGFNFHSTKKYSGFVQDDTLTKNVHLLINNQIWDITVMGEGEGSSYKDNPNSSMLFDQVVNNFEFTGTVHPANSDAKRISAKNQKYIMNDKNSKTNVYRLLDVLEFTYPTSYTLHLFGDMGVWVSNGQKGISPKAGNSLNMLVLDSLSAPQSCIETTFLTGTKYACAIPKGQKGYNYIHLEHKGKKIQIEFPEGSYNEVISSLSLLE